MISVQQANDHYQKQFDPEVFAACIQTIDAAILGTYRPGDLVEVHFSDELNRAVKRELREAFGAGGWRVVFQSPDGARKGTCLLLYPLQEPHTEDAPLVGSSKSD